MTKAEERHKFDFVKRALEIIEAAQKKGIEMRIMGAVAFRLHCQRFSYLYNELKREITDIDFVLHSKFRGVIKNLLSEFGFTPNERFMALHGKKRHIYYDKNKRIVDVFFDKLEMCHIIDFRDRLEIDYPTISLSDLFLEKTQIVELNEKDIKDVIILLREHKVGDNDVETINGKYIARLLSEDWGFYYTVTTNLNRIRDFSKRYEALTKEDHNDVSTKIDVLLQFIEKEPKSLRWKMRAKIGTRKKWYTDVEGLRERSGQVLST